MRNIFHDNICILFGSTLDERRVAMLEGVFVPFRTRIRTTIALLAAYVDRRNHMIRWRIPHVCPAPYFVGLCLQLWQIQRSVKTVKE